jgi:hypothetical protein
MEVEAIIGLNDTELFALANDSSQAMLCDWREAPDAVIEYANSFLPESLQLQYAEDDEHLQFSNGVGHFTISLDEYEKLDEPIPVLVREINRLIAPTYEARYFNSMTGTDGYAYLVHPAEFWHELDSSHATEARRIFGKP